MFYFLIGICVVGTAFFVSRYHAVRTRFVEKEIEKTIARKFATSKQALELSRLREDNAVMRNLLLDLVENEAHTLVSEPHPCQGDLIRFRNAKIQRYREILAESLHIIQHRHGSPIPEPVSSFISVKQEKL